MKSAKKIGQSIQTLSLPALNRPNKSKELFYAVGRGKEIGIFKSWNECKLQVWKFSNSRFRKFKSFYEADKFVNIFKNDSSSTQKVESTPAKKNTYSSDKSNNNEMNFSFDKNNYVEVYTDASVPFNGLPKAKNAGLGVWFGENHPLNLSKGFQGKTNNLAEIKAAQSAVQLAKEAGIKKLKIITDSSFLLNCMTKWIYRWRKNGWISTNQKPIKHKEELENLYRNMRKISIRWEKVSAHSGNVGNEAAHRLACKGVSQCREIESSDKNCIEIKK